MAQPPLSPEQQETQRQRVLKEYIWLRHQSHKADPKRAKPPREDDKNSEEKEPHLDAQALIKGNLAKGVHTYAFIKGKKASRAEGKEYYAWNAWNFLGTLSRGDVRDIYRGAPCGWYDFYQPGYKPNFYQAFPIQSLGGYRDLRTYKELTEFIAHSKSLPGRSVEEDAQLQYAATCRSKVGMSLNASVSGAVVGCAFPYRWQAHHLLPMNCFYTYLKDWHVRVILSSDYDINAGSNIIFLPERPDGMRHHKLPFHRSSHVDYDIRLKGDFQKLLKLLNKKRKNDEPHEAIAENAEARLHKMETEAFQYLARSYGMRKLT